MTKTSTNNSEQQRIARQFLQKRLELINLIDEEICDTRHQLDQLRDELAMIDYQENYTRFENENKQARNEVAVQVESQPLSERPVSVASSKSQQGSCSNCNGTFCSSSCFNELKEILKQLSINNNTQMNAGTNSQILDSKPSISLPSVHSTPQKPNEVQFMVPERRTVTPILDENKLIKQIVKSVPEQEKPSLYTNGLAHMIIEKINSKLTSIGNNILASKTPHRKSPQHSPSLSSLSQEESSDSVDHRVAHRDIGIGTSFVHSNARVDVGSGTSFARPNSVVEIHTEKSNKPASNAGPEERLEDAFSANENILIELENLLLTDDTEYLDLPQRRPNLRTQIKHHLPFASPQSEAFKRDISQKMFQNKDDPFPPPFRQLDNNDSTMFKSLINESDSSAKMKNRKNISIPSSLNATNYQELDREQFWSDVMNNKHNSLGEITF